jgi:hypothetical protein
MIFGGKLRCEEGYLLRGQIFGTVAEVFDLLSVFVSSVHICPFFYQ